VEFFERLPSCPFLPEERTAGIGRYASGSRVLSLPPRRWRAYWIAGMTGLRVDYDTRHECALAAWVGSPDSSRSSSSSGSGRSRRSSPSGAFPTTTTSQSMATCSNAVASVRRGHQLDGGLPRLLAPDRGKVGAHRGSRFLNFHSISHKLRSLLLPSRSPESKHSLRAGKPSSFQAKLSTWVDSRNSFGPKSCPWIEP
jgi:hypothetical protein